MLLNVGPTHDGRIMPIFEEILLQIGLNHWTAMLLTLLIQVNGLRSMEVVFMVQFFFFHGSIKMTQLVHLSGE